MHPQSIFALLTDSTGQILLVRRKESLLWTLPGGDLRAPVPVIPMLTSLCRRQIGVAPDFVAPFLQFTFAGKSVAVGLDEIPRNCARACRQIEISSWFQPDGLPVGVAPLARMAIALRHQPRRIPAPALELAIAC